MERKEIMQRLIQLNNFFIDSWNEGRKNLIMEKKPEFTNDWLNTKFDRFYLVESTTHTEEVFEVQIELRYALRSKEAAAYGSGHSTFHNKYLNTIPVSLEDLNDPENYKKKILEELTSLNF